MGTLPLPNTRVSKQKIADIFLKEKGLPAKSKGHGIKVGTGWVGGWVKEPPHRRRGRGDGMGVYGRETRKGDNI